MLDLFTVVLFADRSYLFSGLGAAKKRFKGLSVELQDDEVFCFAKRVVEVGRLKVAVEFFVVLMVV